MTDTIDPKTASDQLPLVERAIRLLAEEEPTPGNVAAMALLEQVRDHLEERGKPTN